MDTNSEFDWNSITEQLDNLVAVITGYKAKFINAGFAEEAAEHMAMEFHSVLMQRQLMA